MSISGKLTIIYWIFVSIILGFSVNIIIQTKNHYDEYAMTVEECFNSKKMTALIYGSRDAKNASRRIYCSSDEIPSCVVNALIATEDPNFYEHSGIDFKDIIKAMYNDVVRGKYTFHPTITEQLAYTLSYRLLMKKYNSFLNEPIVIKTMIDLERFFTKQELLTIYLNDTDFLHNAIGIYGAAIVYFSTTPDRLKTEEAAMLVGMMKNPSLYNPTRERRYDKCLERRNHVLEQMAKYNYITPAEKDSLCKLPIVLRFKKTERVE